jgi:hypothetical protein
MGCIVFDDQRLHRFPTFHEVIFHRYKVKVKLSQYRLWRPLGLQEVEVPTFSDIWLTYGGRVVSPTPYPQEDSWYSFLSRPQGHSVAGRFRQIEKIHLIRDSNRRPSSL